MLAGLKDMSVWTATAADGANASIERRNAHSKIVIGQVIANRMHDAASLLVVTVIRKRQYINLYLYFSLWVWVIQFNSIQFFERGKVKRRKVSVFYSVLPVDQIRSDQSMRKWQLSFSSERTDKGCNITQQPSLSDHSSSFVRSSHSHLHFFYRTNGIKFVSLEMQYDSTAFLVSFQNHVLRRQIFFSQMKILSEQRAKVAN